MLSCCLVCNKNTENKDAKMIKIKLMNFINQLLENLKKEYCILLLETIFGVFI